MLTHKSVAPYHHFLCTYQTLDSEISNLLEIHKSVTQKLYHPRMHSNAVLYVSLSSASRTHLLLTWQNSIYWGKNLMSDHLTWVNVMTVFESAVTSLVRSKVTWFFFLLASADVVLQVLEDLLQPFDDLHALGPLQGVHLQNTVCIRSGDTYPHAHTHTHTPVSYIHLTLPTNIAV